MLHKKAFPEKEKAYGLIVFKIITSTKNV